MEAARKKRVTLAVASVALVAIIAIVGTFAYLQASTDDVVNTFSTNQVTVDLTETTGNDYNIVPGTTQNKNPKVTVDATLPAYAFAKVTDNTQGLVDYAVADGWMKLDGYDDVYYREVEGSESSQDFYVLKDNQVSYSSSLTNEDMKDKSDISLTFKAYAIQKEGFENDAAKAYLVASTGVVANNYITASDAQGFADALGKVSDGDAIVLTGNLQLDKAETIENDVTIVGDGDTLISGYPLTTNADVTFEKVAFEKPVNASNNATIVYAQAGTEELVFENCTFSNPQWEAIQATSSDLKSIVIDGCTFNADNVQGAESSYGNTANQCIRFIHVQPNAYPKMDITITNNTFNNIANVKDSIVGIYYVSTDSTITVGGNTFSGWGEGDLTDNDTKTGKLSVGWPEVEALKTVSVWEGSPVTYTIKGSNA